MQRRLFADRVDVSSHRGCRCKCHEVNFAGLDGSRQFFGALAVHNGPICFNHGDDGTDVPQTLLQHIARTFGGYVQHRLS